MQAAAQALTDEADFDVLQHHPSVVALVARGVPHLHLDARRLQDPHPLSRLRLARVCSRGCGGSGDDGQRLWRAPGLMCAVSCTLHLRLQGFAALAAGSGWCLPRPAAHPRSLPLQCAPLPPHYYSPLHRSTSLLSRPMWVWLFAILAAAAVASVRPCTRWLNRLLPGRARFRSQTAVGQLAAVGGVAA